MFLYINLLHDILKDQNPFPLIRMPLPIWAGLRSHWKLQKILDTTSTGRRRDTVIEVVPRQGTLTRLRRRNPGAAFDPHRLRLVKYAVGDTVFILGTTLLDRDQYSIDQLSDLYHARWGIAELYKISKRPMEVEDFHGQSERGVKQELYACMLQPHCHDPAVRQPRRGSFERGGCRTTASH